MCIYMEEPIQVNYHLVKFGGHRHCDRKSIIILASKFHATLWAGVHQSKLPFCQIGGHRLCGSRDETISVCHVII